MLLTLQNDITFGENSCAFSQNCRIKPKSLSVVYLSNKKKAKLKALCKH